MGAKQNFKKALVRTGRWYARSRSYGRVVVLCYHTVHPTLKFATVTPSQFSSHLKWLKQTCRVVNFSDIPLEKDRPKNGRPTVAITFDDGYADNYQFAFPLLLQHGLTATFFVTNGLIDREQAVIQHFMEDRKASRKEIEPMSWEWIREMARFGMEIGDHTHRHPNLAHLSRQEAVAELSRSRSAISDRLGRDVNVTAFPYGKYRRHYTDETMEVAQEVGFERAAAVAFRCVQANDSPFAVPRFFITRDDIATLNDKVLGAWDVIGHLQDNVPTSLARLVSPLDFQY